MAVLPHTMPIPRISSISPTRAVPGGRLAVHGTGLLTDDGLPVVRLGHERLRVVFASARELGVMVTATESGRLPVRVGQTLEPDYVVVGRPLVTGIHQVDSPVFDRDGRLYVTYSGTRGQQVPITVFRVTASGARESFSSVVSNPTSLALAPDGQLYVSSRFEGAVYRLDADGSAEVYASDLGIACGLAFAPDGTLFVGDRSGTIFEVGTNRQTRTFATLPPSVAAFHLALGTDALYATAPTLSARDAVYRIAFDGTVSVFHAGFGRPQGLAFGPDGALYVVEALAGVSGLYRVEGEGTSTLVVSGARLVGLAFDAAGDLVLCSSDTAYLVDMHA